MRNGPFANDEFPMTNAESMTKDSGVSDDE
jgi:hypothetical protein